MMDYRLQAQKTNPNRLVFLYKYCPKCSGRGYKRVPSSVAYQAIKYLVPDLNERTWRRNRKPFYEGLTGKCHIEESQAESWFEQLTC
ncbi:hypothetical protein CKG00_01660 [Morganella morganii]|uniref:Uncharacterized protein n=1 Tax=Morganella morganii TaxID=582 RepID=A0A433ZSZ2_MORMO|nr:hypothetical protein CKG00_01660 [Morganella morganii]